MNSEDHIFRGDYADKIYRSTDDGDTWEKVSDYNQWCSSSIISKIIFDPQDSIGFAGCSKTTDNGRTWYQIQDSDESFERPYCIDSLGNYLKLAYSPYYKKEKSLHKSTDKGKTWTIVDTSLKHFFINFMTVSPNGYIYVSAQNGGLYRSRERFVSVQENVEPEIHEVIKIIPNPVSDETTITYNLSKPGNVTIALTDILGREVAVLIKDEYKESGFNNYELRITNYELNPGIYFIILRAGEFSAVEKMVVLK